MRVIRGGRADSDNDRMNIGAPRSDLLGRKDSNLRSPDPESSDPSGPDAVTGDHQINENTGGRQAPTAGATTGSVDQRLSLDDRLLVVLSRRRDLSLRVLLGVAPGWAGGLTDEEYVRELEALLDRMEAAR